MSSGSTLGGPQGQDEAIASLRSVMKAQGNQVGWEHAWNANVTPWEMAIGAVPQPALVSTCEKDDRTRDLIPRTGKAVVPGCGRGQDVEYLAKRGLESTGIDISPKAVERAREVRSSACVRACERALTVLELPVAGRSGWG